ncbi:MAG: transcriptional repressor LexA [Opitutaceae bacterium]|jgi:repressor LexA|nr:transcriptional repressor LexA [Opitutaceae bacterium]
MLTARQEEILDFIRSHQLAQGIPPSTRVIQKRFGFASQNSVMTHLRALAAKGAVDQFGDGSWGVRAAELQGMLDLPIYGAIPAGLPDQREQQPIETLALPPATFGLRTPRPGASPASTLWGLRISGDSMIGAQIQDGDIGIFERREPRPGEIIAALVDGVSTTLKRLVKTKDGLALRAENPRYPDIHPQERLECQGVLVGLIRQHIA